MLTDGPNDRKLSDLKERIQGYVGEEAAELAIGIIIHAICKLTIVGQPVLDALKDLRQRRINERVLEVLTDMNDQLKTNRVNTDYFKSEEFQTLLALMVEQLATTHDKEKLHLLASALANSADVEFCAETRKELFMRILRNLAPEHVRILRELMRHSIRSPEGEELAIIQTLVANGLADVVFRGVAQHVTPRLSNDWSMPEAHRAITDYIKEVLERSFTISRFGRDFMKFLGESSPKPAA